MTLRELLTEAERIRYIVFATNIKGISVCIALTDSGRYNLYIDEEGGKPASLPNSDEHLVGFISGPKHQPYEDDEEAVYNTLRAHYLSNKISDKARKAIKDYINNNNTWFKKDWYKAI